MYQLEDVSLLVNEFYGMIDISYWPLMNIAQKRSIHNKSPLLQVSSTWSIYLKNVYAFHNAYKGEDQNNDLSYGQLDHSVGISDFELEQMKMNFHRGI